MLTVSEALCCDRPDLVARYLAALQRAASWAAEHEREAVRIVAAEVGLAEKWARLGYHPDTTRHLHLERSHEVVEKLGESPGSLAQRGFLAGSTWPNG